MRVGLISDTHGHLRPEVFDRLEGVEHILHAGDVGPPDVLADLRALAPVDAVWGNTDGWDVRDVTSERLVVELDGWQFAVVHGHRVADFDALTAQFPGADVILHGHSHVPRWDRVGEAWILNPGSAGPGGEGWPPSVAVAELSPAGVAVVHLDLLSGDELIL